MKHEKTFEAIYKLKDIEIELHRLKNALEMANKALDAQRTWVGLTDEDCLNALKSVDDLTQRLPKGFKLFAYALEAKLKELNT